MSKEDAEQLKLAGCCILYSMDDNCKERVVVIMAGGTGGWNTIGAQVLLLPS
jgi:hypothetical protein